MDPAKPNPNPDPNPNLLVPPDREIPSSSVIYSVHFVDTENAENSTVMNDLHVNESYIVPATTSQVQNKIFIGWSFTQNYKTNDRLFHPGEKFKNLSQENGTELTLYSVFWDEADTWNVTFVSNEVTLDSAEYASFRIPKGSIVAGPGQHSTSSYAYMLPKPDSDGYYGFKNWVVSYETDDPTSESDSVTHITASSDLEFTAVWAEPVTVTLNSEYGTIPAQYRSFQVVYGTYIAPHDVDTPVKEAYNPIVLPKLDHSYYGFAGWAESAGGENHTFPPCRIITEDTTLTAQWKEPVTITFKAEHGDISEFLTSMGANSDNKITVKYGTYAAAAGYNPANSDNYPTEDEIAFYMPVPEDDIYALDKWKFGEGDCDFLISTQKLTQDMTFTATYKEPVTVTFSVGEGDISEFLAAHNADENNSFKIKAGTVFGNPLEQSSSGYQILLPDPSTDSVELDYWKENGNRIIYTTSVNEDTTFEAAYKTPYYLRVQSPYGDFSEAGFTRSTIEGETDIWYKAIHSKVSVVAPEYTGKEEIVYKLPMLPMDEENMKCHTGWLYKANSNYWETRFTDGISPISAGALAAFTFIPEWKDACKVTITSEFLDTQEFPVAAGSTIELPEPTDPDGVRSLGWWEYSGINNGLPFDGKLPAGTNSDYVSAEEITYKAVWGDPVTLSFIDGETTLTRTIPFGGTVCSADSSDNEADYAVSSLPDTENDYFDGWEFSDNGFIQTIKATPYQAGPYQFFKDMTFTALWKPFITVTLTANYGTLKDSPEIHKVRDRANVALDSCTITYEPIELYLPTYTETTEGYTFDGWYMDKRKIDSDSFSTINDNKNHCVTITAVWNLPE